MLAHELAGLQQHQSSMLAYANLLESAAAIIKKEYSTPLYALYVREHTDEHKTLMRAIKELVQRQSGAYANFA